MKVKLLGQKKPYQNVIIVLWINLPSKYYLLHFIWLRLPNQLNLCNHIADSTNMSELKNLQNELKEKKSRIEDLKKQREDIKLHLEKKKKEI